MPTKISIIGCGAVGKTLALALKRAGYTIAALASRSSESAEKAAALAGEGGVAAPVDAARSGDLVFITTPDSAIVSVCDDIAEGGGFGAGQTVLHCSGALTAEVLRAAREQGAAVGALHPLQTFADPRKAAEMMSDTAFFFQGDDQASAAAEAIVAALRGRIFRIPAEGKPLYHAASAIASNYLVALVDAAVELMQRSGMEGGQEAALEALMPLIRGAVNNLDNAGLTKALTGPIARGDAETVRGHIEALEDSAPHMLELYRVMGLRALDLARRRGLPIDRAKEIDSILRS